MTNNDKTQPEELEYLNKSDMQEVLFGLNLYGHNKSEIDYSFLCLETVDIWLNRVESSKKHSKKQNLAITSVLKGRRLLRASQLQIFKGYILEAEIIYRSMFETQLVLSFVLDDKTNKQIDRYFEMTGKGIWDFRLLCEDLLGKDSYEVYKNLSQYPHPYNLGRLKLVHNGVLQSSAIHKYEDAGNLLVQLSNSAVALCEESNVLFQEDPEWEKKHQEIYDTDIFKKNIEAIMSRADNGDKNILRILSKVEEKRGLYNKN